MTKKTSESDNIIAEFKLRLKQLETLVNTLQSENKSLRDELDRKDEIIINLQRTRFGQSSEKQKYVSPDQLSLFNEAELEQDPKVHEFEEETITVPEHKRRKKRTNEDTFKNLPAEDVIIDISEEEKYCNRCGNKLRQMGKKFLRTEVVVQPKVIKRINYYTYTYTCDSCENNGSVSVIVGAQGPEPLIKHSYASPSIVADVMTQKYADGVPLFRQEKVWKRAGIELSRATMANWIIKVSDKWLKPLYRRMKHYLLEGYVIYADETVVQVLKEDGKSPTSESRMWVYGCDERSGKKIRVFEYQPDRKGEHANRFLKDFEGCLVTDGYQGYNLVKNVIRCGCWAHMRRKWREAMPEGATTKNSKAAVGYQYCNKLFALEKKWRNLDNTERLEHRQNEAEKLVDEYFLWVRTVDPLRGGKLADAITYALNQENYLREFLNHGEVEISNNFAENAIRPFVVGRRNWLFSDTVKGAKSSAIVYSIIETAKANGIEPYAYLVYVLTNMVYLGRPPFSNDTLDGFLPWNKELQESIKSMTVVHQ